MGGGGGGHPSPPHPFILQNCVYLLQKFAVNSWKAGSVFLAWSGGGGGGGGGLSGLVFGGTLLLFDDGMGCLRKRLWEASGLGWSC